MVHCNDCGCIPNVRTPESVERINHSAAEWDAQDKPPVSDWASFEEWLKTQPDRKQNWWEGVDVTKYFTPSQSYRPNCAGFSLANASTCAVLSQIQNFYSEQYPKKYNPMVTWQKSKGGSVYGGQSISAIALAGNEVGNFLADDVGDYNPDVTFTRTEKTADENALAHQVGFALYDGSTPWEAIMLAVRKGYACFVGNSRAVSGCSKDANGVYAANLRGSWSHATTYAGWIIQDGVEYAFWINSHGNIYETPDGTPAFGCWMSANAVKNFMSSDFNDLAVITYAEAPYDLTVTPTLNPNRL